ncbi:MAG: DUF4349 domain-containing protein [Gemmatirosa sp.]
MTPRSRSLTSVAPALLALLLSATLLACDDASAPKSSQDAAREERAALSQGNAAPSMARDASGGGVAGKVAGAPAMAPDMAPDMATDMATDLAPPPPAAMPAPLAVQPSAGAGAGAGETTTVAAPAMLIRTGQASVEVDSLEPAIAAVRALATRMGGYVANTALSAGREQVRSATLQLKVPSARFDALVGGLAPVGRVETVNVSAEDVGEEYVDVAARVANARRLEARLVTLLERSTSRLSDVLAVERELARVREEIERAEGRLRFLRTRVALSTLDVTVHERAPILAGSTADNPLLEALRQAWRNFVGFLAFAIASLGVLIPLALVAALAWRLWRRMRPDTARAAAKPAATDRAAP